MKPSHLSDFTSLVDRVASENTQTTDSLVSEALRSTWHIVNTAKNLVFMCVAATPNKIAEKRDAQLLLLNCLTDLLESLMGCRAGFLRGPGMIIRGIWENLAVAIAIHNDKERHQKYSAGKFDPPKAVTVANKVFTDFGRNYGEYSNFFVHETYMTIGRGIETEGDALILLNDIAFTARYIAVTAEFIACPFLQVPLHFHRWAEPELLQQRKDTPEDKLLLQLAAWLKEELDSAVDHDRA